MPTRPRPLPPRNPHPPIQPYQPKKAAPPQYDERQQAIADYRAARPATGGQQAIPPYLPGQTHPAGGQVGGVMDAFSNWLNSFGVGVAPGYQTHPAGATFAPSSVAYPTHPAGFQPGLTLPRYQTGPISQTHPAGIIPAFAPYPYPTQPSGIRPPGYFGNPGFPAFGGPVSPAGSVKRGVLRGPSNYPGRETGPVAPPYQLVEPTAPAAAPDYGGAGYMPQAYDTGAGGQGGGYGGYGGGGGGGYAPREAPPWYYGLISWRF